MEICQYIWNREQRDENMLLSSPARDPQPMQIDELVEEAVDSPNSERSHARRRVRSTSAKSAKKAHKRTKSK